jgi:hypothetical protein
VEVGVGGKLLTTQASVLVPMRKRCANSLLVLAFGWWEGGPAWWIRPRLGLAAYEIGL